MCCSKAKWKREVVQDHKFDFVDVHDFERHSCPLKVKYTFVFVLVLKSILVYMADLGTAVLLLVFDQNRWNVESEIMFRISKWVFLSCIFISFILLVIDMKKARKIIRSRDISYTFTNVIATRYYTLRSYAHYCFFSQINESKKMWNAIAFFVFFRLKGWKRLLFAEAPRQAINAFTLYSILNANQYSSDIGRYGHDLFQKIAIFLTAFTLLIFIGSAILLGVAFLLYIPLLCHIQGNLKEYLCHKIDKRIGRLLKRKQKSRVKAQLRAKVDSAFSTRFSDDVMRTLREPTLPQVHLIEDGTALVGNARPPPYNNAIPPGRMYDVKKPEVGQRVSSETTSTAHSSTATIIAPYESKADMPVYSNPNPAVTRRSNQPYPYAPLPSSLVPGQPPNYRPPSGPGSGRGPGSGPGSDPRSNFGQPSGPPPRQPHPPRQPLPPRHSRPSTELTGSRGGGRGATIPSRYEQDQRVPRYNNYAHQGGRHSRG